ncbi:MAG: peptidyl-prolyl cis-trans isomerase [Rhodanobacteraceae bacterium]
MNIRFRALAVMAMMALLASCGSGPSTGDGDDGGTVIHLEGNGDVAATVNGAPIPEALLDAVANGRGLDPADPDQRKQALSELTQYVLLAQQADRLKVDEQPDLAAMAEAARLQGLAAAVLQAYNRAHPVTDKMVAADYARQAREAGNTTYRFTQLLFDSKPNADKAAAELASGKSFKDVYDEWSSKVRDAQQYSGVFPRQLPAPLATALTSLKQGGTTASPVQSKLGWHLLHLDGTDSFKAPPLTKVEDQVRRGMQEKQAKAWVNSLKDDATISVSAKGQAQKLNAANAQPPAAKTATRSQVVVKDQASTAPAASASGG